MDTMDERLKEFVRLHHLDLLRRTSYQAHRLKDDINEEGLLHQLSSFQLTNTQVILFTMDERTVCGDSLSLSLSRMTPLND